MRYLPAFALLFLSTLAVAADLPPATAPAEKGVGDFPKLTAADWPWWRGPTRNGVAASAVPVKFSATENVAWSVELPGRGHSSPVVVGERVYLTTADDAAQTQSVLAVDCTSRKIVWQTEVSRGEFPRRIHDKNTHATPTVACDGERLFVVFYHHDLVQLAALDLAGKPLWQKNVSRWLSRQYAYGYAPSPVLYRDLVIVAGECESDAFIAAFDRKEGRERWRTPREKNTTYSTPSIGRVAGRDQLLLSGSNQVASYDPATGRPLWDAEGTTDATCGTMVWEGDIAIASGGYPRSETIAVRADGSGTVVWKNNQKCYEQSLIAAGGHVYALTDGGVLYCWRIADGEERWKQRLRGPVSASPILAGGHIYWANEGGTMYVFKANPERLELVAENKLGDGSMASPAVSRGRLFLRVASRESGKRVERLYCIAGK
jgi:outer membrane protein assembly factor BamB